MTQDDRQTHSAARRSRSAPRQGRFVDDIHIDGLLHAVFVRSPHAHAKILSIGKDAALAAPGVRAVLTADDIARHVTTDRLVVALPDRVYKQQRDRPILAKNETVYVGEPLAIVIADEPYLAEDAAALVEIDYEPLACRDRLSCGARAGCRACSRRCQHQSSRRVFQRLRRCRLRHSLLPRMSSRLRSPSTAAVRIRSSAAALSLRPTAKVV